MLVVQAGEYLEYVGGLDVEFDPNGELVQWDGDTVFLSRYITPDPQVIALVERVVCTDRGVDRGGHWGELRLPGRRQDSLPFSGMQSGES